jgi:hypothetical protein
VVIFRSQKVSASSKVCCFIHVCNVGVSRIGALETAVLLSKEQTTSVNLNVYHPLYVNAARSNKTDRPYTTLYYGNPKSYVFLLHDTTITRLLVSEI